jgi:NAD+ synthase
MKCELVSDLISSWIKQKVVSAGCQGLVIGISGGIDSAVTSTLCAQTGLPVICLNMPIHQAKYQFDCAFEQIKWLTAQFKEVSAYTLDLTSAFDELDKALPVEAKGGLSLANSRSRLRMITSYSFANAQGYLVCGTGNKVEDYGIGFFTKYGDGGVDISPIGDLLKSEVYELAGYLEIPQSIQKAVPTDGLWENNKTDEDQIGASYDELEWAMAHFGSIYGERKGVDEPELSDRQNKVLDIYCKRHESSLHKMVMPPVCDLSQVK